MIVVFFFKQQTADEMRISDGSSDVCSSDLSGHRDHAKDKKPVLAKALEAAFAGDGATTLGLDPETAARTGAWVPPGMAYGASHDDLPPADANNVDGPDRVDVDPGSASAAGARSDEHTAELQSLMRNSDAVSS